MGRARAERAADRHRQVRHRRLRPAATPLPTAPTSCCCRCAGCARSRSRLRAQPLRPAGASTTATMATAAPTPGLARRTAGARGRRRRRRRGLAADLPRVLGHAFKPVSFWYCHRADGTLARRRGRGEQHLRRTPLLPAGRRRPGLGPRAARRARCSTSRRSARSRAATASASCARADGARIVVRIDHDDADGPLLLTSVTRPARAADAASAAPRVLAHAAADAGRGRAHPLAGAAPVAEARALLRKPSPSRPEPSSPVEPPCARHRPCHDRPPCAPAPLRAPTAAARRPCACCDRLQVGTLTCTARWRAAALRPARPAHPAPLRLQDWNVFARRAQGGDIGFAESLHRRPTGARPT